MRDITGKRFGRLTALEYLGGSKWKCLCDCGNITAVKTSNLNNGHTQSCGCISREQSAKNGQKSIQDLTGKKFGKLTVVEYAGSSKWRCQCDCGNFTTVHQNNLCRKTGATRSCGCLAAPEKANEKNIVEDTNLGSITNLTVSKANTTGVRGVCYHPKTNNYSAYITFQKRRYYLKTGSFEECARIRKEAEENLFGNFLKWYNEQKQNNKGNPPQSQ